MKQSDLSVHDTTHGSLTKGPADTLTNSVVSRISDAHGMRQTATIAGLGTVAIVYRERRAAGICVSKLNRGITNNGA